MRENNAAPFAGAPAANMSACTSRQTRPLAYVAQIALLTIDFSPAVASAGAAR